MFFKRKKVENFKKYEVPEIVYHRLKTSSVWSLDKSLNCNYRFVPSDTNNTVRDAINLNALCIYLIDTNGQVWNSVQYEQDYGSTKDVKLELCNTATEKSFEDLKKELRELSKDNRETDSSFVLFDFENASLKTVTNATQNYIFSAEIGEYIDRQELSLNFYELVFWTSSAYNSAQISCKIKTRAFHLKLNSKSEANIKRLADLKRDTLELLSFDRLPDMLWEKLNSIVKSFVIQSYGKDVSPHCTVKSLDSLFAIMYFPTEPGLLSLSKRVWNTVYSYNRLFNDTVAFQYRIVQGLDIDPIVEDTTDLSLFHKHFGKVPSYVRKAFLDYPLSYINYEFLKSFGLKDPNIIQKYLKNDKVQIIENTEVLNFLTKTLGCSELKATRLLFQKEIAKTSFYDTLHMIVRNKHRFTSEHIKRLLKEGVSEKFHDYVAAEINKMGRENITFNISEDLIKCLEMEVDGYQFKVAEDSHRLIDIGTAMSICVGSYDERVRDRKCIIAYAVHDDEYVGCFEIRNYFTVWQARGKYNEDLEGDAKAAFEKWLKVTGLSFTINKY